MFVVQVQQVRVQSVRRQSRSHSCGSSISGQGCCMPVVAGGVDVLAQFIDGHGSPCDHAATVCLATVEVPQIRSIAGVGGHSSSQQRRARRFMATMKVFLAFFRSFLATRPSGRRAPGEPSMMKSSKLDNIVPPTTTTFPPPPPSVSVHKCCLFFLVTFAHDLSGRCLDGC